MSSIPRIEKPIALWTAARWVVLLVTVSLIVSFWLVPEGSLALLWYVLIPILPAVFLINVELWRNVCPLSTLNMLAASVMGRRTVPRNWFRIAGVVGMVLLAVMVPARRFLFNVDATVLGVTVVAVCVLAILGGFAFEMKVGFCNAVCPVLPVERLYGQRPLMTVPNARCVPCTVCTKGCLDLVPERSAAIQVGNGAATSRWMFTAYGIFGLAFPGFVISYYLLQDGVMGDAGLIYGTVALWTIGSWVFLGALFSALKTKPTTALLYTAALAVGLYYWFAPPGIAQQFGLPTAFTWCMRVVMLGLVGFWLIRGLKAPINGRQPVAAGS